MKAKILCALDVKRALSAGEKVSLSDCGSGLTAPDAAHGSFMARYTEPGRTAS